MIHIAEPSLGTEEWESLREPIQTGWLTQGPKVSQFEEAFAKRHHAKHALAVTSCTTGLHLALAALGIGPGDEVIVPAFSWVATANVVLYCGATPKFVDVDKTTFNIMPQAILEKINSNTKAIIPVHLFGLCADIDAIRAVIPQHVAIIEDAACAAGASYNNRPAGTLGEMGVFSFHPRKSITTGEGGMITTMRSDLKDRAEMLRNHGASISEETRHKGPKPYLLPDFNLMGFNYRMTDLQGALGLVQLSKLDQFIQARAKWASWYKEQLSDLNWLQVPEEPKNGNHAWQAFVCYVDPNKAPMPRNQIMEYLQAKGIATRPGTHAIHKLGYYRERFGFLPEDFPNAKECDEQSMAIPLHNKMTEDNFEYIVSTLKSIPSK